MHEHGQGVNEDEAKALMYYRKAAKNGDENAIRNRDMLESRQEKK
jgi:TPR repeat protein